MKKLVAVLILVLMACGDPPLTEGTVIDHHIVPAHWESGYRSESRYGYHCGFGSYDMEYSCGFKHYTEQIYEEQHRWVEDQYVLTLEACVVNESNEQVCRQGEVAVTQSEYHAAERGTHFP